MLLSFASSVAQNDMWRGSESDKPNRYMMNCKPIEYMFYYNIDWGFAGKMAGLVKGLTRQG